MTDDIVTRLRIESASSVDVIRRLDMKCLCCPCCEESCLYCETVGELNEAADEIERLRAIIQDIANAATDEGIKPGYHRQQVNYVRTMWNPLWQAIGKAVKEVSND